MIDFDAGHLGKVLEILLAHVPECEIRVFGSRVSGGARKYSDLDIALRAGDSMLDHERMRLLREAFEESDIPVRIDVIDLNAVSAAFREIVEKNSEILEKPLNPYRSPGIC